MVSDSQVQQLMVLGMSRYTASVYLALLRHEETASAAEVSERAEVPRQRVYDVLASLCDQGFVVTNEGRPMRYMALDPNVALGAYLEARRREHQTEINSLEAQVALLISELEPPSEAFSEEDVHPTKGQKPLGGF